MEVWLCLAGGNALGAFHVGAWSAVTKAGLNVTRIAGASIGGVAAAIIAGNAPERREEALHDLLRRISLTVPGLSHAAEKRVLSTAALLFGNPYLYRPGLPGLAGALPLMPSDVSLFRREAMRRILEDLIDFDRLNASDMEVMVTALDAETGEVNIFRNRGEGLRVEHLLAGTALPVLFAPVTIDGRTFFDPGLAQNLPLPALLDREEEAAILAFDLYPLRRTLHASLNGIADRAQDLAFASQSARAIAGAERTGRQILHVVLDDPEDDFVGKAFDYGARSLHRRAKLGEAQATAALGAAGLGAPGAAGT